MTQQLLTPYQSQYYAWLLTRRAASDTVESLASTLVDSQVGRKCRPAIVASHVPPFTSMAASSRRANEDDTEWFNN